MKPYTETDIKEIQEGLLANALLGITFDTDGNVQLAFDSCQKGCVDLLTIKPDNKLSCTFFVPDYE